MAMKVHSSTVLGVCQYRHLLEAKNAEIRNLCTKNVQLQHHCEREREGKKERERERESEIFLFFLYMAGPNISPNKSYNC